MGVHVNVTVGVCDGVGVMVGVIVMVNVGVRRGGAGPTSICAVATHAIATSVAAATQATIRVPTIHRRRDAAH